MKRLMSLTILGIGLLILAACGKDDETQGHLVPTIIPDPSPTATIAFISTVEGEKLDMYIEEKQKPGRTRLKTL